MNCSKNQKLIYLHRQGELSSNQYNALHKHLKTCAACKAEYDMMLNAQQHVMELGSADWQPDSPQHLTDNIMRSIRNLEHSRSTTFSSIWQLVTEHSYRFVLATITLLIVGYFVVQEAVIMHRISGLEHRMASTAQQHNSLEKLLSKYSIGHLSGADLSELKSNGDQIVIDKASLERFLKSYKELEQVNKTLSKLLDEQTKIDGINVNDGLSLKELETLLQQKEIQQKLQKL